MSHSHKLEPQYTGPYFITKVSEHKKSAELTELHTNRMVGTYHINHMNLFV